MKNKVTIDGDVAKIEIISKHGVFEVLIDAEDVPRLEEVSSIWVCRHHTKYDEVFRVKCCLKEKRREKYQFHRFVLNAIEESKKLVVDHINHNCLDNRKENLHLVTQQVNLFNRHKSKELQRKCSSKYQGVYWSKVANKWHARIQANRQQMHLGYFEEEIDAAIAYAIAKNEYHKGVV